VFVRADHMVMPFDWLEEGCGHTPGKDFCYDWLEVGWSFLHVLHVGSVVLLVRRDSLLLVRNAFGWSVVCDAGRGCRPGRSVACEAVVPFALGVGTAACCMWVGAWDLASCAFVVLDWPASPSVVPIV
jgi:hypothetical protein